jgi:hypothetical protein
VLNLNIYHKYYTQNDVIQKTALDAETEVWCYEIIQATSMFQAAEKRDAKFCCTCSGYKEASPGIIIMLWDSGDVNPSARAIHNTRSWINYVTQRSENTCQHRSSKIIFPLTLFVCPAKFYVVLETEHKPEKPVN